MAQEKKVWTPESPSTGVAPNAGDQFIAMGNQVLVLRRPYTEVSVIAIHAYIFMLVLVLSFPFQWFFDSDNRADFDTSSMLVLASGVAFSCILCLFVAMHIRRLKMTPFYFNRHTQHVYGKEGNYLFEGDWRSIQASPTSFIDASNVGAVVRYRLHMLVSSVRPMPPHRFWQKRMPPGIFQVCIMSNQQADPRTDQVAQVWEYIRSFMAHGPDGLPIPAEPNWWMLPLHQVVLTPSQALRHYVPWRTGEPGERQGKKNWLLPFWALLFPLTISVSLCWWIVCCLLRVHPLVPPVEALEGETAPLVTIEMASKGVRP